MKLKEDPNYWSKEYEAFLGAEEVEVPETLTEPLFRQMHSRLNPAASRVFLKILMIHLSVGFLSLSVCHQFGMNPFGTKGSLDHWFMSMWGHNACMLICGSLFLSASVLTAGYFLTVEELFALKKTEFIQSFGLGLVSLVLFATFGTEIALAFASLWLLGALLGGLVATELVWRLRKLALA